MDKSATKLKRKAAMNTVESPAKFSKTLQQLVCSTSTPLLPRTNSKTECDLRQDSGFNELSEFWSQTSETSDGDKEKDEKCSLSQLTGTSEDLCDKCSTPSEKNVAKSGLQRMFLHYDKLNKICPAEKRIGRRIGDEFVDIIGELSTLGIPALSRIFSYLDNEDVLRCVTVSKCWLAAVGQNITSRRRLAELVKKENETPKKYGRRNDRTTSYAPLAAIEVNRNISASSSNSSSPEEWCSENVQFYRFTKEAKNLKTGQRFVKCTRCSGPAKLYKEARRATCTDKKCKFDCCTLCELAYHGATTCLTSPSKKTKAKENPINSKASKKLLKRL